MITIENEGNQIYCTQQGVYVYHEGWREDNSAVVTKGSLYIKDSQVFKATKETSVVNSGVRLVRSPRSAVAGELMWNPTSTCFCGYVRGLIRLGIALDGHVIEDTIYDGVIMHAIGVFFAATDYYAHSPLVNLIDADNAPTPPSEDPRFRYLRAGSLAANVIEVEIIPGLPSVTGDFWLMTCADAGATREAFAELGWSEDEINYALGSLPRVLMSGRISMSRVKQFADALEAVGCTTRLERTFYLE